MSGNIVNGTLNGLCQGHYYTATGNYYYGWDGYSLEGSGTGVGKTGSEPFASVFVLRFSTPSFLGKSECLRFKFFDVTSDINDGYRDYDLRFSLCSSDANKDSYTSSNNYTPPIDQYRISYIDTSVYLPGYNESGWYSEYTDFTVEIKTDKIYPNSEYYLIVQYIGTVTNISAGAGFHNSENTIIEIEHVPITVVCIDNGTKYLKYQCYIDNGLTFNSYIPYIDNGIIWEPL